MKMNLKVRAKNPQFWFQVALSALTPIAAYKGISGEEITSWAILGDMVIEAVSNPYILVLTAVGVYNALIDPTTPGISDSNLAMTYKTPKK